MPQGAFRTVLEATRLVARMWRPLVLYGIGVEIVGGLVLVPFLLWLLTQALTLVRSSVVLNYDLTALATSPGGILLGLLWALVTCAVVVLALGGGVVLTAAAHAGRRATAPQALRSVVGVLPHLLGRGLLKLTAWVGLLAPLAVAFATASAALLLAPFGAEPWRHWLPDEVRELAWFLPAALAAAVLAFVFYVRWCLTIHCLVLERCTLSRALRRSVELVRGRFWATARLLLAHYVAVAVFVGVVTLLLGVTGWAVLQLASVREGARFPVLIAFLVVVKGVVLGLAGILGVSSLLGVGTILYVRLAGGLPPVQPAAEAPALRTRRKLTVALIVVALGTATGFTVPRVLRELDEFDRAVAVMAHRGSSAHAPENTLAAIRMAIEAGADYAEIDIQQTRDGALVVHHDESLERTAGLDRKVQELTLAELKELDVGSHFDAGFAGERIPTLQEALAEAQGRIRLNIELKAHGAGDQFAEEVVRELHAAHFGDRCVIQSNDLPTLRRIRALDPTLRVGVIVAARVGDLERLDVDFYSVQPQYATVTFVRRAHLRGRKVYIWTINDGDRMRQFLDRGVDGIITDDPRLLQQILAERSEVDELAAAVLRLFSRDRVRA